MILDLPQDSLLSWRKKAYDRFSHLGFPKKSHEGFQYLPLTALEKVWPKPALKKTISLQSIESALVASFRIVFVDGIFDETLSLLPQSVIAIKMDAAMKSYGLFLQNRWTKAFKDENDPLLSLNGAQQGGGAFIYIPPGLKIADPIQILHVATSSDLASPRTQITLGKQAAAAFIQTTLSQATPFINGGIDFALEAGAAAKIYDATLLDADAWAFCGVRATIKRDARLEAFHATTGAKSVRFSAQIELLEENSSAQLQGLSMLTDERQSHIHARIEHAAPHCQSRQHIKMALNGKSRSSFEGKIYVHPVAQKTEAYQLNKNLLLSDEASANAKPNLEIFADDVKASHGATVAQLSDDELFYLRSRGLTQEEAKKLLLEGFCRELIESAPEALRGPLLTQMAKVLQ